MHQTRPLIDRLDRATPLQRAILQVLTDEDGQTAPEVFAQLDLFTPSTVTDAHRDAVAFAVTRALGRLEDEGLVASDDDAVAPRFTLTPEMAGVTAAA